MMDDVDCWIYFDGSAPESVRPLLDALARPSLAEKERVMRAFFASFDERIARPSEERAERGRRSDVYAVPPPPPPPAAPAALSFAAWAELSIRLIGAAPEQRLAALGARGLTIEAWTRLDDDYLRVLSADLLAGRTERPALYAARCQAEMQRRRSACDPPSEQAPALTALRAPNHLRGTADAIDLPAAVREAMGKLPFKAPAAAPPTPAAGTARTLKVRAMPSLGETLPVGSDAIQKAVATVPFAGSMGGAGLVTFPALTMKQYVSLRADLRAWPDRATETLRRYGVPNETAWRALEAHWQERFAASAELRAEREAAMATYVRWLCGESG